MSEDIKKFETKVEKRFQRIDTTLLLLDKRLTHMENEFKDFRKEFTEFKNQNLSLLDAIYKLLTDGKVELDLTKTRVFDNHEPRIITLEEKIALA